MKDFNPDWSSPPSDTIKDILEERGDNYDDFLEDVSNETRFSVLEIKLVFDGVVNMPSRVADILSKYLGSTKDSWIKRSTLYRDQPELKYEEGNDYVIEVDESSLVDALKQCLAAQVKREDAPCSSETHLNSAIALLSELVPDYEPQFEEMKSALEWAIKEGRILRGEE